MTKFLAMLGARLITGSVGAADGAQGDVAVGRLAEQAHQQANEEAPQLPTVPLPAPHDRAVGRGRHV